MKTVKISEHEDRFSPEALVVEASQEVAEGQQRKIFNKWLLKRAQLGFTEFEQQLLRNFYHALTSTVSNLFEGQSSKASGEVLPTTSLLVTLYEALVAHVPYAGNALGKGGAYLVQNVSVERTKRVLMRLGHDKNPIIEDFCARICEYYRWDIVRPSAKPPEKSVVVSAFQSWFDKNVIQYESPVTELQRTLLENIVTQLFQNLITLDPSLTPHDDIGDYLARPLTLVSSEAPVVSSENENAEIRTAYHLLRMTMLAVEPESKIHELARRWKYHLPQNHASYAIVKDMRSLVLATPSQIIISLAKEDSLYLLNTQYKIPGVGSVHAGFYADFQEFWRGIKEHIVQYIEQQLKTGNTPEVYLTGHGLGGVFAAFAVVELSTNYPGLKIHMQTFGQPRMGDTQFQDFLEQHTHSFSHWSLPNDPMFNKVSRSAIFADMGGNHELPESPPERWCKPYTPAHYQQNLIARAALLDAPLDIVTLEMEFEKYHLRAHVTALPVESRAAPMPAEETVADIRNDEAKSLLDRLLNLVKNGSPSDKKELPAACADLHQLSTDPERIGFFAACIKPLEKILSHENFRSVPPPLKLSLLASYEELLISSFLETNGLGSTPSHPQLMAQIEKTLPRGKDRHPALEVQFHKVKTLSNFLQKHEKNPNDELFEITQKLQNLITLSEPERLKSLKEILAALSKLPSQEINDVLLFFFLNRLPSPSAEFINEIQVYLWEKLVSKTGEWSTAVLGLEYLISQLSTADNDLREAIIVGDKQRFGLRHWFDGKLLLHRDDNNKLVKMHTEALLEQAASKLSDPLITALTTIASTTPAPFLGKLGTVLLTLGESAPVLMQLRFSLLYHRLQKTLAVNSSSKDYSRLAKASLQVADDFLNLSVQEPELLSETSSLSKAVDILLPLLQDVETFNGIVETTLKSLAYVVIAHLITQGNLDQSAELAEKYFLSLPKRFKLKFLEILAKIEYPDIHRLQMQLHAEWMMRPETDGARLKTLQDTLTWNQAVMSLFEGEPVEASKIKEIKANDQTVYLQVMDVEADRIVTYRLKKSVIDQLFSKPGEWKKPPNDFLGRHLVLPVEHNGMHFCFKSRPEQPAIELAVGNLCERLGNISCTGSVVHMHYATRSGPTSIPVYLMPNVRKASPFSFNGKPLIEQTSSTNPQIHPDAFTRSLLLLLLLNLADDDEYFLLERPDHDGSDLLGLDRDRAFYPDKYRRTLFRQLYAKFSGQASAKKEDALAIGSILYCLDMMQEPLSEKVLMQFAQLDREAVLKTWLSDLQGYDKLLQELFNSTDAQRYFNHAEHPSYMAFYLPQAELKKMFDVWSDILLEIHRHFKAQRIEQAHGTEGDKPLRGIDLLFAVRPEVASYYNEAFEEYPVDTVDNSSSGSNAKKRYQWLNEQYDFFTTVTQQGVEHTHTSMNIRMSQSRAMNRDVTWNDIDDCRQGKRNSVSQALAHLKLSDPLLVQNAWNAVLTYAEAGEAVKLQQALKNFQGLGNAPKKMRLIKDFIKSNRENSPSHSVLRAVLQMMQGLPWVSFSCDELFAPVLTAELLVPILVGAKDRQGKSTLVKLEIQKCGRSLFTQSSPSLNILLGGQVFMSLSLPILKVLVINDFLYLQSLVLDAPELQEVSITCCPILMHFENHSRYIVKTKLTECLLVDDPKHYENYLKINNKQDVIIKVMLLGGNGGRAEGRSDVGKSTCMERFTDDKFEPNKPATIGVDFRLRRIDMDGNRYRMQIWDTATPIRFRTLIASYYRNINVFILFFDVTDRHFRESSHRWFEDIKTYSPEDTPILLVGNKIDLQDERVVTHEQGLEFATEIGAKYLECSAKNRIGVEEAFIEAAKAAIAHQNKLSLLKEPKSKSDTQSKPR